MSSASGPRTGSEPGRRSGPLKKLADFFDDRTGYRAFVHEALYERFGCKLYVHELARKAVRRRAKCPIEEFDDHGLDYAS